MLLNQIHIIVAFFTACYSHYVVLWQEGSVSAVDADCVKPRQCAIGDKCLVTIGRKQEEHNAIVVARGE